MSISLQSPSLTSWSGFAARQFALPCVAFVALLAMLACTTPGAIQPHASSTLELFAHHLGHEINSIWVGISLLLLVIPSLIARSRRLRDDWAWHALDAILLDFLIIDSICRRFLAWPRPGDPTHAGFPSGHTTFAFLMAWLIWRRFPRLGPLWFAIAAVIGWSRLQVNAHYPYQIIAGALLGCGLGALIVGSSVGVLLPRILLPNSTLLARLTKPIPASASAPGGQN